MKWKNKLPAGNVTLILMGIVLIAWLILTMFPGISIDDFMKLCKLASTAVIVMIGIFVLAGVLHYYDEWRKN